MKIWSPDGGDASGENIFQDRILFCVNTSKMVGRRFPSNLLRLRTPQSEQICG